MRLTTVPRHQQDAMTKIAVVALGGNALTRAGQSGSYDEMMANAAAMAMAVNDVLEAGWRVVVVHGNGPQVGNLALQQEATAAVPAQPLALLGAMTQGMLGSVIARAIDLLRGRGTAAALVTHVTVDPADPAFGAPSKPIGPFFEPAEAERLARRGGWVVQPDSGRGYRRVVASPQPVSVIEIEAMRALVEAGRLVIAGAAAGSRCWPRPVPGAWTRSSTRTGPPASSPGSSAPRPCSWSPRWTG
jgi:carbamate kinase